MPSDTDHTISVPRAGREYFGLKRAASYRAARLGDIPTVKIGGVLRVPLAALKLKLSEAVSRTA